MSSITTMVEFKDGEQAAEGQTAAPAADQGAAVTPPAAPAGDTGTPAATPPAQEGAAA